MAELSRKEMQSMLDAFRVRLLDSVATKQDMQNSRDRVISYTQDYLQQNQQQFIRQLDMRTRVYKDKLLAMESRIYMMEQELKLCRQLMEQMSQRQRNVVIPTVQEAASNREPATERTNATETYQYGYYGN